MIKIRPATESDLDWLLVELREFSKFADTKRPMFGEDGFPREGMLVMIRDHLVLIAESENDRMGFIAGGITPHPFNPGIKILYENFWWVPPQFRNSRAGLLLLNAFVEWGKANANWVIFGLEEKSPVSDRVLLKRGFRRQETSYLMEAS